MRGRTAVVALCLMLNSQGVAGQGLHVRMIESPTGKRLTETLCAVRAGRVAPALLRETLMSALSSSDAEDTLRWLSQHGRGFSRKEVNDFHWAFIRLNPGNHWTRSEMENVRREEFRDLPRDERLRAYREVIQTGRLQTTYGFPLSPPVALSMAAWDGMTELEPAISAHGSDLTPIASAPLEPYTIWTMRLAAGAESRDEAVSLRAKRLADMADRTFFELMRDDPALRAVVEDLADRSCSPSRDLVRDRETGNALDVSCKYLQAIAERQSQYVHELGADRDAIGGVRVVGLGTCIGSPTSWLERLAYAASTARSEAPLCPSESLTHPR